MPTRTRCLPEHDPHRLQRRRCLAAFGAAAAASLLPATAGAATATLKIGTVVWIGYGPFYVADALDLYKKHGLKVTLEVFNDPALIPPAINAGSVDGGMLTYDQVIGQVAAGRRMRVVMPIDYSNGGDAIVAQASIKGVKDFKGRKVGFNPLSPSDFLLSYALKLNGMTEKDIVPVSMTPEAVPAAMASGQLPIGVTYEPSLSQILSQGGGGKFKVVFSSKDAPGLIADVLVFDDKVIQARRAAITALIRGYLDGMAYMKSNPEEAARLIGKFMGISAAEVKEQLAGVYNIPLAEMPRAFEPSQSTTSYHASAAVIAPLLKAKGQIRTIPRIEDTFDASFVRGLL